MGSTGNVTDSTGEEKNELIEVKDRSAVSLALAKEATLEFDGKSCARIWVSQLKSVAAMCKLDEESLRMLLAIKLKGNAQQWLHAISTRLREPFQTLCDQLILAFGTGASKAELRRKFEQRKWHQNERFAMYFEEKIVLAQSIKLDNDEFLEQIIEGIPSLNLRNQARIQRFGDPKQMLQAFAHIRLPKYGAMEGTKRTTENNDKRCHNCNSRGHFAKECRKRKREPGSCYACGEMGHFIAECKKKKSVGVLSKSTGFDNSYARHRQTAKSNE
ncbi:uncharacterized protein LOC133850008 [Drosophila sulfurigaster albostrigata]|uniref:uncharacterized protein LOC133850008 n=1 Tax=Drosophila sulfurigaster albostrigata TaxID=89887 RepID=UPI002D21B26C|nr:uncharacterized protein LOC133850008 [Drosophila sulfurigaster albostrigata]